MTLPWPPSINNYWHRSRNGMMHISPAGQRYRAAVALIGRLHRIRPSTGPLAVTITAHPPDRRRRDIDNILKALLDAMQHGGWYGDDNQISRILIERGAVQENGAVVVELAPIPVETIDV